MKQEEPVPQAAAQAYSENNYSDLAYSEPSDEWRCICGGIVPVSNQLCMH